jgi:tRNA(fMet)-specific endonuclease VapC
MSVRFLLDTSVLSQSLKKRPNPGVMRKLAEHDGQFATSIVTYHELRFGALSAREARTRAAYRDFLESPVFLGIPILPYDREAADEHARARYELRKTLPWADLQIAAIAKRNGLVLVTNHTKDFRGYPGLDVVDWHALA